VVLSGALDDGSAGLRAVRSRGGLGVVQDPEDAEHAGMPTNAIRAADPEYVVPVADMPALLIELIGAEVPDPQVDETSELAQLMETEVAMAEMAQAGFHQPDRPGTSSGLSCPDCHGVLFAIHEEDFVRFRCRVGHAWSAESLLAEHRTAVESALWMALRALEEKAALCDDMSRRAELIGAALTARRFTEQAGEATEAAELLRNLLADGAGFDADYEREGGRLG
jgi:two-component system chemotaxis response regulator CheB